MRAIWFNKSAEANWLVAWHQDLAIAVRERVDVPGFEAWSVKEGVPHVQPPAEVLQRMLTVRIHLDDADGENGALRVIAGTHRLGRLSAEQIAALRAEREETLCVAAAGDALLMRPLLLHASGRSTSDRPRRVLHLEYAGQELAGRVGMAGVRLVGKVWLLRRPFVILLHHADRGSRSRHWPLSGASDRCERLVVLVWLSARRSWRARRYSLMLASALAQLPSATAERPPLPASAEQWANSSPLSYDGMKGKAVVFWYFEEKCPTCAKKWVGLKELAEAHADDPVLFVGVNSGTEPRQLAAYMDQHGIDWPVIADVDRSFEQASGINEISLQNIHQVKVLTADGKFVNGQWNDLPATVETALQGAAWKTKYDRLNPAFHAAVRRMEYGDYRPAARAIAAGLKDKSPEIKKTAAQLQGAIEKKMTTAIAEATAGSDGDPWVRFTALEAAADAVRRPQVAAGLGGGTQRSCNSIRPCRRN